MISVYRIGVELLAVNGVSPILRLISREVLGLGRDIDKVGTKFGGWHKSLLAVGGALTGIGVGLGLADLALAKIGDKLVRAQQGLRAVGVSPADVSRATDTAIQTALRVPGATPSGMMDLTREFRMALGEMPDANTLTRIARSQQALRFQGYENISDQTAALMKALELFGAGTKGGHLDPESFAHGFEMMTRISGATMGLMKPTDLLRVAQTGGMMAQMGSFEQFVTSFAPVIMAMGSRAGTGMMQSVLNLVGGKTTAARGMWMERLGLLAPGSLQRIGIGAGGGFFFDPKKLTGFKDIMDPKKGLAYWLTNDILPALKKHGVNTSNTQEVIAALSKIAGGTREARLLMETLSPAVTPRIEKERELFRQAMDTDPLDAMMQSLEPNLKALSAAIESLFEVVGARNVPAFVGYVGQITGAVKAVEALAIAHPEATTIIVTKILPGLAVGLAALGAIAVVAALVAMVGPAGLLVSLGIAIVTLGNAFDRLKGTTLGAMLGGTAGFAVGGPVGAAAGALVGAGAGATLQGWMRDHPLVPSNITVPMPGPLIPPLTMAMPGGEGLRSGHGLTGAMPKALVPFPSAGATQKVEVVGGHVAATVTNGKDIAQGVSKFQADQLRAPSSGITGFNSRRDFLPPGMAFIPPGP